MRLMNTVLLALQDIPIKVDIHTSESHMLSAQSEASSPLAGRRVPASVERARTFVY